MPGLGVVDHVHFLHRAWRYRLRTEKQELAYVRSRRLIGRTVVDVGAHRGIYSYWLREAVGPSGRVVAFEPQPEMIAELKKLKHSFRARNIDIIESGLTDTPGTATLRRVGMHTGGASLEPAKSGHADADESTFEVPVTTLDTFFAERTSNPSAQPLPLGPVALIKCDVEGHEQAVFRGAERLLREDRPALLFECHDAHARAGDVFEDLRSLGYVGWLLDGQNHHPVERFRDLRDTLDKPYLNYIFEPEEATTLQ